MSDHTDLFARLVAMEQEAYSGSVAFPYFYVTAERPPFWVNRLGPATYDWDSEEFSITTRDIIMRLVIANLTQGYDSESERLLLDNLDAIILYFRHRPLLTSSTYPAAPDYLYSTNTDLVSDGGLVFWQASPDAPTLIGIEFTMSVIYLVDAA